MRRCISCEMYSHMSRFTAQRRIAGERMTSGELIRRIRKGSDALPARWHGGGVTFSGANRLCRRILTEVLCGIQMFTGFARPLVSEERTSFGDNDRTSGLCDDGHQAV